MNEMNEMNDARAVATDAQLSSSWDYRIWSYIERFSVSVDAPASGRLYRNGFQWARVKVLIDARDSSGNHIQLPPQQLQGDIKLIRYAGGADLPSSFLLPHHDWASTPYNPYPQYHPLPSGTLPLSLGAHDPADEPNERDLLLFSNEQKRIELETERYRLEGRVEPIEDALHPVGLPLDVEGDSTADMALMQETVQVVYFYVRTTSFARIRLGARIYRAQGNGSVSTNNGDNLDSSVTLEPVELPNYSIHAYGFDEVRVWERGMYRCDNYYVTLEPVAGRKIDFVRVVQEPGQWHSMFAGNLSEWNTQATVTGYAQPGSTAPICNFPSQNNVWSWVHYLGVLQPRPGAVVVFQVLSIHNIPFDGKWVPSKILRLTDIYGNVHRIRVTFKSNFRWLEFSKA